MNENKNLDPKLAEVLKGIWDALTEEQKEKAKTCKTMDELVKLAAAEGIELPDEALDAVSGGFFPSAEQYHERFEGTDGYLPDVYEKVTGKSC